ncbi:hypothetical protein ACDX77_19070 [Bacillus velezensis]|uniref:hypothetical protein n=1 Tax=Bacillus velezensis TaxID=492670 RepID=UPI003558A7D1
MTKNKVESIEEQIKRLQEKKKEAIEKLEKTTGKKFLEAFDLRKKPIEDIEEFIEELKRKFKNEEPKNNEKESDLESEYQNDNPLNGEKEHVGFTHS